MKQPHANSYYADSANIEFNFPELQGEQQADVCVIGSGITGASAALELAKRGYKVIVLEAQRVGWGASGRSGGQAIFGWGADQYTLEKLVNKDDAKKLWDLSVESLDVTKGFIKDYNIDCDWRDGMVHLGLKDRHDRELKEWYEDMTNVYGYQSLELWDKNKVRENIDSDRYSSGLFDSNSGHLHPLNYTLGLVKAAKDLGAEFYEGSEVNNIKYQDPAVVETERGSVKASHVVLAGNAYMKGVNWGLESRVMPVGTYVCATEPLGKERALKLLKNHISACDINFVLDYFRCSGDYRMLFGGKVSYSGIEPRHLAESMRKSMLKVFPQLADVKIESAWGGNVAVTINRGPHFGRLKDNIFYAQGFSGHGIAAAGLAGKLMAEAVSETAERLDVFEKIKHLPFDGGKLFRTPAMVLGMAYYRLRDYM
ncbi:NAD(P)/FAD-dependent oxidoreductase [Reinekea marinisedimentorum]|uniref:Gamma-glutamylputrescine oxidase n=1 Tax=Reinekea marinisedimentorum TaxID=230495 RepID=A0A4R3I5U2_9GAMM|nr:FAD-binding oxidoreductase [Reinekea marinisedimentorum]TCS40663.1 gamma-glutamylputrescine oxidase [Reinekea marinisedimentorum]